LSVTISKEHRLRSAKAAVLVAVGKWHGVQWAELRPLGTDN
jgi:hypothetical protein